MSTILTALLVLLAIEGAVSLIGGVRFHRRCRWLSDAPAGESAHPAAGWPRVALLVPCKGREPGLAGNLRALVGQDYPRFVVWLITATGDDGAVPAIDGIRRAHPARVHWHIAGLHEGCAEKVAGLRTAVEALPEDVEVVVTADSDGAPDPGWLRRLVASLPPLSGPPGTVTGYRWYLPARAAVGPWLQSVWNAAALSMLDGRRPAFTWGGATAMRLAHLRATDVLERWRSSVSDDYSLTRAVAAAGGTIRFAPDGLVPCRADLDIPATWRWIGRQMLLTRVYAPRIWWTVAVYQGVWTLAVVAGAAALPLLSEPRASVAGVALVVVIAASAAKGTLRWRGVRRVLAPDRRPRGGGYGYGVLAPLVAPLTVMGALRSSLTRRMCWRGVVYTLRGPEDTEVVARTRD